MRNNSKRGSLEDCLGLCLVYSEPTRKVTSWVYPGRSGIRLEALLGTFFLKPILSVFPLPQHFYIFIARYKQVFLELFFKNKRKVLAVCRDKPKAGMPTMLHNARDWCPTAPCANSFFLFQGRGLTDYPIFFTYHSTWLNNFFPKTLLTIDVFFFTGCLPTMLPVLLHKITWIVPGLGPWKNFLGFCVCMLIFHLPLPFLFWMS